MDHVEDRPPIPKITALTLVAAVVFTFLWQEVGAIEAMRMNESAIGKEPWRLVTSVLAHGGFLHLAFNLYWIWKFGKEIETWMPSGALLGLFALTGFGGAAAQFAVGTGGIGLSGVVYGLVGFLWIATQQRRELAHLIDKRTLQFFGLWFIFCILLTKANIFPVANTAHGVGALLGMLAGWCYFARSPDRLIRWGATTGALAVCLSAPRVFPISLLMTPDLFARSAERIDRLADHAPPEDLIALAQLALSREDSNTEIFPGADYFWYVSAFYKSKLGQDEAAVREAHRALELNPHIEGPNEVLTIALFNLSIDAIARDENEKAVGLLREVLRLDSSNLRSWEVLAKLHHAMGSVELAEQAERRAAALR